jgi:hypothetical protein
LPARPFNGDLGGAFNPDYALKARKRNVVGLPDSAKLFQRTERHFSAARQQVALSTIAEGWSKELKHWALEIFYTTPGMDTAGYPKRLDTPTCLVCNFIASIRLFIEGRRRHLTKLKTFPYEIDLGRTVLDLGMAGRFWCKCRGTMCHVW